MIWIVLAIIVAGYLVANAIRENGIRSALMAQKQIENTPEFKKQKKANDDYFYYKTQHEFYTKSIYEDEIKLLEDRGLTADRKKQIKASITRSKKAREDLRKEYWKEREKSGIEPNEITETDEEIQQLSDRLRELQNQERMKAKV